MKSKKRKFGPPFYSDDKWFKYIASEKDFPFDKIDDETVKLKFAPIQLQWPRHEKSQSIDNLEGRTRNSKV